MRRYVLILTLVAALLTGTADAAVPATAGHATQPARVATVTPACADITPSTQIPGTPVRILAIGDSITAACQWQRELDRLLTKALVPHVITTYAVGATDCYYWTDKISGVLATARPDLAYTYCGTNDDPNAAIYGENKTAWSTRYLIETIHGYRNPAPLIVPTLIGYSDGTMSPDWLWATNEPRSNDAIYGQLSRYQPPNASPSWLAGIGDVQLMPGTAEYLDGDTCDPGTTTCAVHPNAKGYRTIGRLLYDRTAAGMGWPAASMLGEPVLCGMAGHRKGYPRPSYTPCQG